MSDNVLVQSVKTDTMTELLQRAGYRVTQGGQGLTQRWAARSSEFVKHGSGDRLRDPF